MHPTDIPQYAVDNALKRRGTVHTITNVDPAKTALVVIDMQNVFMKEGAPAEVPVAREIVPNINRLAQVIRNTGGKVIWVQMTHTEENTESWTVFYKDLNPPERASIMLSWMSPGSEGQALWPDLDTREYDLYVEKNRYSAFMQGSSNIVEVMEAHGLDTAIITGTVTNVCCESSARDAMMLNIKPIMVSDGNAASTDDEHLATMASMIRAFGDVYTTDEMISLMEAGTGAKVQNAAE